MLFLSLFLLLFSPSSSSPLRPRPSSSLPSRHVSLPCPLVLVLQPLALQWTPLPTLIESASSNLGAIRSYSLRVDPVRLVVWALHSSSSPSRRFPSSSHSLSSEAERFLSGDYPRTRVIPEPRDPVEPNALTRTRETSTHLGRGSEPEAGGSEARVGSGRIQDCKGRADA